MKRGGIKRVLSTTKLRVKFYNPVSDKSDEVIVTIPRKIYEGDIRTLEKQKRYIVSEIQKQVFDTLSDKSGCTPELVILRMDVEARELVTYELSRADFFKYATITHTEAINGNGSNVGKNRVTDTNESLPSGDKPDTAAKGKSKK